MSDKRLLVPLQHRIPISRVRLIGIDTAKARFTSILIPVRFFRHGYRDTAAVSLGLLNMQILTATVFYNRGTIATVEL